MEQTSFGGLTQCVRTLARGKDSACQELDRQYDRFLDQSRLSWQTNLQMKRRIGAGGQGTVFLAQRVGADGFHLPVAVKVFSPERYQTLEDYDHDMERVGSVSAKVARIQHENLLVVNHFIDRDRIRIMIMEWVEGFDLRRLLTPRMFGLIRDRVSEKRWRQMNDVLVTTGPVQPRFRAGIAIAIIRDCLAALAALHREEIVHGDIKPANIMLKRAGTAKIIDIGSAMEMDSVSPHFACTPAYAAPELLTGGLPTESSDIASLGYVAIELLAGTPLFSEITELETLIDAKLALPNRLNEILPAELAEDEKLISLCQRMIASDPDKRFESAEAAERSQHGVTEFLRDLVKMNVETEYEPGVRNWIEELIDAFAESDD